MLIYQCYLEIGHADVEQAGAIALHLAEQAKDLIGQGNVIGSMGVRAFYEGDWDRAAELYGRAHDVYEQAGHTVFATSERSNIAEILSDRGLFDEAEPMFRQAIRTWRAARYQFGVAYGTLQLGRTVARAGRFDEASQLLRDATEMFVALKDEGHLIEAIAVESESAVLKGEGARVMPVIDDAIARATRVGGLPFVEALLHRTKGWALIQAGRAREGIEAFEKSLEIADAANARFESALSVDALARTLRACGEDAESYERRASELFEQLRIQAGPETPRATASLS